ncbi:MAG TPA: phospholipase D-like domain-containing protein [Thermoanaerobaculia bacterium]|jgi:cardiolipin synthase|nr:phospholipase D-like domain-containing protein [Thermoanaerobaculia bacterium]
MNVTVPIWVVALLGFTIAVLILILWSVKRRRRPHLALEPTGLDQLVPSIAGLTQGTCVGGNKVELLQNGAMWDRVFADIAAARETVNYETFLCKEGELTRRMAEALVKKAREKVQVRVMLDGSGGKKFGKKQLKDLKEAGAKVRKYHPMLLSNLGLLNNRDHRKIFVIDGRIAYVGGHCLTDNWLGEAQDKQHFRDISARVEGPVVAQLQSAFAENWIEETGEVPGGANFFPELERAGDVNAHAVWLSPSGSPSTLKLLHYLLIRLAKKRLTIQNPYFLPDPDARKALLEAVKRGVEVRVMIPADTATDAKIVQHASHHHYGTLLKGGVRLFDYQKTLLHQKIVVVDGMCASIGSTNFDDRSFEINDEVSLVVYDEAVAGELEATFERDLPHARERHFDEWKKRPVLHKLRDFFSFLANEQL